MKSLMVFHDVDDLDHWLASPKRREVFGPAGITARPFVDADRSNHVGLFVEIPSMEVFDEVMASPAAAEAMKFDGVRPETLRILTEG